MECIRDKETRELFSYIKRRHSVIKINEPESIEGELKIKSVRKYPIGLMSKQFRYEVDIEFKGCVWGRGTYSGVFKKYEQSQLASLSKVRLYRLMRQKLMPELKTKLSLFDVQLNRLENITKIKWVG